MLKLQYSLNQMMNRTLVPSLSFLLIAGIAFIFCVQIAVSKEIKLNLQDERLETECDWAMYLDVQDMQKYLNYGKSKLHPLSRVRISFRSFPRSESAAGAGTKGKASESKSYEELWYHHRTPVGSRRFMKPDLGEESLGMIVLGPSDGKREHTEALTNAMIRLMLDLQFQKAKTSIVLVPEKDYDELASGLNYYNFSTDYKLSEGKRMSIHLCSSSSTKEGYFYLGK